MEIVEMDRNQVEIAGRLFYEMWPHSSPEEETDYCFTILDDPNKVCFLAVDNGIHIGFAYAALRTDFVEGAKTYPISYLEGIYVNPAHRQKEVGKLLVSKVERWAQSKGCSQIASDAEIPNTVSQKFHHRMGFKEENRIVCFIKDISH